MVDLYNQRFNYSGGNREILLGCHPRSGYVHLEEDSVKVAIPAFMRHAFFDRYGLAVSNGRLALGSDANSGASNPSMPTHAVTPLMQMLAARMSAQVEWRFEGDTWRVCEDGDMSHIAVCCPASCLTQVAKDTLQLVDAPNAFASPSKFVYAVDHHVQERKPIELSEKTGWLIIVANLAAMLDNSEE